MTAIAHAISLNGITGVPVRVEAQVGAGLVSTRIVGLADTAVRESKERLRSALLSCQIPSLNRRLTISLSPASLPKNGSSFDLPIAVAVLTVRGAIDPAVLEETVFAAELGLDGTVRPVVGVLAQVWAARERGFKRIVVSAESMTETQGVKGIEVIGCSHLRQLLTAFPLRKADSFVTGWQTLREGGQRTALREPPDIEPGTPKPDLLEVRGQPQARAAALIAAAGGHHLLLFGAAGSGKTMIAERIGTILPALASEEAMILAAMRSAAGITETPGPVSLPPIQILSPTTTEVALLGGGQRQIRPGLVSLAHGGVLVLNEAPDFAPRVLDALRGPLDDGQVTLRRAAGEVTFPARFQLVLTANECPCGGGDQDGRCECAPHQRRRYQQRLSGPLLDRVDIQVRVSQPTLAQIQNDEPLDSATASALVAEARERSTHRWAAEDWQTNSQVPGRTLRAMPGLPPGFSDLLERSIAQGRLSLRGADRILRVAWSAADLAGHRVPTTDDLSEALALRTGTNWGNL